MQCSPYKEAFSWLTIFLVPVFVILGGLLPEQLTCSGSGPELNQLCTKTKNC